MRNENLYKTELDKLFNILHGEWRIKPEYQAQYPDSVFIGVYFDNSNRDMIEELADLPSARYFTEIVDVIGNVYTFKTNVEQNYIDESLLYIEIINGTNIYIWSEKSPKYPYKKDIAGVITIINNLLTDEEE